MRDHIINEIQRLAKESGGQAPGQKIFAQETGISEHQWRGKFWARWGDALVAAGFEPNKWNERHDSDGVLAGIVDACRHFGRVPTNSEIEILRSTLPTVPSIGVVKRHFGRRADLIDALWQYAVDRDDLADIVALLPERAEPSPASPVKGAQSVEGFVYLIKSGDFYKIGRSDDAERRFKQISIALPDKAELFHTIRTDDPPGIEAYWHHRFADRRANGEWFKLSSLDVSAFKKRKFQRAAR